MGTASLRQLLRSLCTGSDWDYAVFWKLKHENPKFLSWEDGFVNHPKPRMSTESLSYMPNFNGTNNMDSFDEETILYGCPDQTGLVVADMSCLQYAMGERLVGKAASTGNDYWIYSHDISTVQFKYNEPFEFPGEWIPQFMAGFKTVLLVPVLPHGVLQLGSFKVIAEDTSISDRIKERYYAHRIGSGISSSSASEQDTSWHASLAYIASFMDEVGDQSAITCSPVDILPSVESDNCTSTNDCNLLTFDPAMALQKILEDAMADKDPAPSLGCYSEVLIPINGENDGEETGFEKLSNLLSVPLDNELFKASGFQDYEYLSNVDLQRSSCLTESQNLSFFNTRDFLDSMEPSAWDFDKFPCIDEAEECLETVVSFKSVLSTLSEGEQQNGEPATSASFKSVLSTLSEGEQQNGGPATSASFKSVLTTLNDKEQQNGEPATPASFKSVGCTLNDSEQQNGQPATSASLKSVRCSLNDIEQQNGEPATSASKSVRSTMNDVEQQSGEPATSASLKCVLSTLDDTEKQKGAREGKKKLSGGKRKARTADGQKQRPRDRQLIQDRVKELRELVPNGSKCSIDALLDLTVKHMGFLRGITDQAEKLRKCTPHKKSRPFGLGNESGVYPVVVEDIENLVGHLLIEMLCEEEGLFLEIAEVIRRLDLTIVKGVLESRADNTCWASFIVEASKGFQRTDIFWPLMQVLQRKRKPVPAVV